jgi:hypothetical protein
MANKLTPFLDNLVSGALSPKGNLADYQHASRLYVDDAFKYAPKSKFLYHVAFNINRKASSIIPQLSEKHSNTINMLVKSVDLPKFDVTTEVKHQYNRKRILQKRIDYSPCNFTFHDDNYGLTTAMWEAYYRYYFKDGNYASTDTAGSPNTTASAYNRANTFADANSPQSKYRYGFDNDSIDPFFDSIVVYQMSRKRYTAFTLVNPIINSWQHDTMDQTDGAGVAQSTMSVQFETVWYTRGAVSEGTAPKGFATEHYDKTPSPLSLGGGGTSSLFGVGGVASGAADVFGDITSGDAFKSPGALLGTVLKAANTARNVKDLSKDGIRQEGFGIIKGAIGDVGGINVGGVANTFFPKGSGSGSLKDVATAVAGVSAVAAIQKAVQSTSLADVTKELQDNKDKLDDLSKSTTHKKDHLAAGGDASVNAINAAWDTASSAYKEAANSKTLANLPNIVRTG